MNHRIALPGLRLCQRAWRGMIRATTPPKARHWMGAAWVAGASVALALSGCASAADTTTATTTATRQPHLYVTTYLRPSSPSSAAPTMRVASLAPADGSAQWQMTSPTAYPFDQTLPTADGGTLYTTSDKLPSNPSDTSTPTGALSALRASDSHTIWKAQLGAFISAPVVSNGILYSSAIHYSGQGSSGARSKWLYALHTSDGSSVWKIQLPGDFGLNDEVTLVDGVLYIASNQFCFDSCSAAYLFAVRAADGKLLWKQTVSGNLNISAPTVDHGVVYLSVPTDDLLYGGLREIVAYDAASGASLWTRVTYLENSYPGARQFVSANGLVYTGLAKPVASDPYRPDHWTYTLVALDGRTGAIKWQVATNLYPFIVAHDDEALYVQTQTATASGSVASQSLTSYTQSDGGRRWQAQFDPQAQFVDLGNGALYGVVESNTTGAPAQMMAVSASDGARRWQIQLATPPGGGSGAGGTGPLKITSDALYMAVAGTKLYALDPTDGHTMWGRTFDGGIVDLQYVS